MKFMVYFVLLTALFHFFSEVSGAESSVTSQKVKVFFPLRASEASREAARFAPVLKGFSTRLVASLARTRTKEAPQAIEKLHSSPQLPAGLTTGDIIEIETSAEGEILNEDVVSARDMALREALKKAIKTVIENRLDPYILKHKYEELNRKIFSRAENFIARYEIRSGKRLGKIYTVVVNASVSWPLLQKEMRDMDHSDRSASHLTAIPFILFEENGENGSEFKVRRFGWWLHGSDETLFLNSPLHTFSELAKSLAAKKMILLSPVALKLREKLTIPVDQYEISDAQALDAARSLRGDLAIVGRIRFSKEKVDCLLKVLHTITGETEFVVSSQWSSQEGAAQLNRMLAQKVADSVDLHLQKRGWGAKHTLLDIRGMVPKNLFGWREWLEKEGGGLKEVQPYILSPERIVFRFYSAAPMDELGKKMMSRNGYHLESLNHSTRTIVLTSTGE